MIGDSQFESPIEKRRKTIIVSIKRDLKQISLS